MAYISSLSLHGVTSIKIEPVKEHETGKDCYSTRTIVIMIGDQQFEITCFSSHVDPLDDSELMPCKI